ncbi:cupin domain-containing protein [Flagellimonas meishanensis]|uniref:cupin domain-containing protein n=1 Tax=Flagellimonas meishanensis TaxID=2873264 RepID=UPI00223B2AD5|nr:cupin domain-containing protein [[Muricauda] meishanensis]
MDMYRIDSTILDLPFTGLTIKKSPTTSGIEILCISLEKGAAFPEHSSPKDARLIVVQGNIEFNIANQTFQLSAQQSLSFPKEEIHSVKANEDSKFLIIRS